MPSDWRRWSGAARADARRFSEAIGFVAWTARLAWVTLGEYLAGLAFFTVTIGGALWTAWALQRRWFPDLSGVSRVVAISLVATTAVIVAHLLPGIAGLLSRESVAATAALLAALASLIARRAGGDRARRPDRCERSEPSGSGSERFSWIIAAAGVGIVSGFLLASAVARGATPAGNLDALAFHLPGIGRWIQSGTFWQLDQFIYGFPTGEYPQNGDVLLMAAILPWENDAFVRLVNYVFVVLAGLAVYAIGRELRVPRATALLFAALAVASPAVLEPVDSKLMTDAPSLACLGGGLLFLVRHSHTGRKAELVLAGIGLGLAFGTKWYGVSAVVIVLGVWAVASLAAGRPWRRVTAQGGALCGVILAVGGFWFLRNLVETGNPLFPVRLAPFGVEILDAPPLVGGRAHFSIADYLDQPAAWTEYILPAFADTLALPALLLALCLPLAAVVMLRRAQRGDGVPGIVIAGLAIVILLVIVYSLTPGSAFGPEGAPLLTGANTRWLAPALIAAAPLAAWAVSRFDRGRIVAEAVALVAIAQGVGLAAGGVPLGHLLGGFLVVGAVGAALALSAGTRRPFVRSWRSRSARRVAAVAATAVIAAAVLVGYEGQRQFNDGRYMQVDAVFDAVLTEAPSGYRIGISGDWDHTRKPPIWPMFGPRVGNEVETVGSIRNGLLRRYTDRRSFVQALQDRDYDLLVVALGAPPEDKVAIEAWATSAGFREIARSDYLALYGAPTETSRADALAFTVP